MRAAATTSAIGLPTWRARLVLAVLAYIDSSSNGLTFVVDRFKEEPIAGHITLVKGERSDLAELAAILL